MKRLLNILYVLTEDSYLSKQGETICIHVGGNEKVRVPIHNLESVLCFSKTTVSTPLIAFCGERGIGLAFFSEQGRFYGRIEGPVRGNVLLRTAQYFATKSALGLPLAKNFVAAKIANGRNVLLRSARESKDPEDTERLQQAAADIACLASQVKTAENLDQLRGAEGIIANRYFAAFDRMIKVNREEFNLKKRTKRPPVDRTNALLSFLYMLLANDVRSALEGVGLDPAVGYLHALRPGRPSLALDLMEELRAPLCDRMVVAMINLKQVQGDDFDITPTGININEDTRKTVITAWQKRKKEEIIHPYLDEKVPIGLIPHLQAQLLARHLRGDLDFYPPFYWK
ncbi:CRISPR-associated protein Cas1 [Clostridiales bacterium PH28_bin88]|nr:CRISPR-associated protein Cas1 [Clostridiales bacterium PH28_bin88]